MSKKILGDTIDLHSGGVDLLFPHHENEIAQSQCCNGTTFSNHWYHSEHLLVDGKKMSKSLGNLYTLDDLKARRFSPETIRYALLMGHPRKQLNFTLDSLHAAESALNTLKRFRSSFQVAHPADAIDPKPFTAFFEALNDDLNTPGALGVLFTIVNKNDGGTDIKAFDRAMFALGINLESPKSEILVPPEIKDLAERRWSVKKAKDFATADRFRKELHDRGWIMFDGKDDYKLEPLKK